MTNYEIRKVAENSYGLFDTDMTAPYDLIVLCPEKPLLEKIKQDFIRSDIAQAKAKIVAFRKKEKRKQKR